MADPFGTRPSPFLDVSQKHANAAFHPHMVIRLKGQITGICNSWHVTSRTTGTSFEWFPVWHIVSGLRYTLPLVLCDTSHYYMGDWLYSVSDLQKSRHNGIESCFYGVNTIDAIPSRYGCSSLPLPPFLLPFTFIQGHIIFPHINQWSRSEFQQLFVLFVCLVLLQCRCLFFCCERPRPRNLYPRLIYPLLTDNLFFELSSIPALICLKEKQTLKAANKNGF